MKTPVRTLLLSLWLASFLGLPFVLTAQDDPPLAPTAPAAPAEAAETPEIAETPETPEAAEAPEAPEKAEVPEPPEAPETVTAEQTPAAVEAEAEVSSAEATEASTELRRLDAENSAEPGAEAEKASAEGTDQSAEAVSAEPDRRSRRDRHRSHRGGGERVSFWHNSTLGEGESASAVVSIFGSSTSAGHVHEAVVSVFGSSTSTGTVGDAVVSVLGSSRASGGRVGAVVVSVFGNTYVDTEVGENVVAVLGNIELGPNAVVNGELICVGGVIKRDPKSVVHGPVTNPVFGVNFGGFEWLHAWISQCLMWGRPLAFGPNLMWAWWLALGFLAFYIVIALLFPRGVEKTALTFEHHPGYSLLSALLVTLLTPLAAVVLAITIIGTPALIVGLFVATLFGKVVMLAWIGRRITHRFGDSPLAAPAVAVLLGGIIALLLYTVPIVGFIVMKLLAWLGLGVVTYTIILATKRPKAIATAAAATTVPGATLPVGVAAMPASEDASGSGMTLPPIIGAAVPPPVVMVSAATLPRAGFWIRIAASLLDILIVALAGSLIPNHWQPNLMLMFAAYCCVLWGLKGTTVGGIICGIKIVRLDDRKLDWPTAIVRALGGFLSLAAAGIGFIWVAFDDQKQSWHDKIAGTVIVHVPRGVSLV